MREPAGGGASRRYLAGQPAAGERAVGLEGDAALGAEREDVALDDGVEERVRALHERGSPRRERPLELRAIEVDDPVRADPALGDERVEGHERVRDRRLRIRVVRSCAR
jgi:hypothetical protein